MMDIYNINKKFAQEKLKSDKPIKWIAIYNNCKLEIRAGYVLYHKDLRKKDEPLPIGGGILKIESQYDATWKLSLGGKSDDFGACDLLSFKNEDIDLYPLIDFLCWTLYFDEYVKPFDVDIRFYPYFVKSLPSTDEFNLTNIFRKQYEKYLDI